MLVRASRRGRRRPGRGAARRRPVPGGRPGLEPAGGRRGFRRRGRPARRRAGRPGDRPRSDRPRPGGGGGRRRLRCPCWPGQAAAAGWPGWSSSSGIPGSVGGAVRMNAGGHGQARRSRCSRRAWIVDLAGDGEAGAYCERPADRSTSATGTRTSARPRSWSPAEFGVTARRAEACKAEIDEVVRWRAGQPAGRLQRRLGLHQPARRLGRPAHRRLRPQRLPGRHGLGLGTPRQLLPGGARRPGPGVRRRRPGGRGAAPGGRGEMASAWSPSCAGSPSPGWSGPAPEPPPPGPERRHACNAEAPDRRTAERRWPAARSGRCSPWEGSREPSRGPNAAPGHGGAAHPAAGGREVRPPARASPEGWRAKLPGPLQRPLAWQAPVAGRAVAGAGKAARRSLGATRSLRDRLRRGLPRRSPAPAGRRRRHALCRRGCGRDPRSTALRRRPHRGLRRPPGLARRGGGGGRPAPRVPLAAVDTAAAARRIDALPLVKLGQGRAGVPQQRADPPHRTDGRRQRRRPAGGWRPARRQRPGAGRPSRPPGRPARGHRARARSPVPAGTMAAPVRRSTSWPR